MGSQASFEQTKIEALKHFESDEEHEFYLWLIDAKELGLVTEFESHPKSFTLSEPVIEIQSVIKKGKPKSKTITLLRGHIYTADFCLVKGSKMPNLPFMRASHDGLVWVDVKGNWTQNTSEQKFSVNRKWMYAKFGLFINKIIPEELFERTWCPDAARLTKKKCLPKKKYIHMRTAQEYIKIIEPF